MDAAKLLSTKGAMGISDALAVRMAIAEALRDLSDEIESGQRVVLELQSSEVAMVGKPGHSLMFMRSALGAKEAK